MTVKNQTKKRKINKTNLWVFIISGLAILAFVGILIGTIAIIVLLQDKPTLNIQDFEQTESTTIYDYKGNEVANLGLVIRQNSNYNELPNCLVDAFVAIEDSRFFEHNGFDLPRFTKAIFENLRTLSFGQGGSTFTMQLIKNTYFTNDDTGEEASRSGVSGIKRKVQEIALALELEKYEPKQFIFESYLNKLNYGGSRNIRGIQKASQYYFSKDVTQLNLNEAAFLAGVVNAPYYYSPFTQDSDGQYHLQQAQEREEEVLYQMYHHGYISKQEYELALSVQVKDLLTDPYSSKNNEGNGVSYQAYVDQVVNEAIELTGMDPYTTTMHIYTYMNTDIQKVMDEIQAQTKDDYLAYPDDYVEVASVCIDNSTGQVVGILGGRNYAGGGQLLLNHATEQYKQPGSSIKPILDYALAFENLGWATDHVLHDVPMFFDSSNTNIVYNYSNTYVGDVTLKQACGESINTCAVQTMQQLIAAKKNEYIVNYAQSLGYDFNLDDFNVQYSVGGSTCEVTPYQHAAAYAAIMNGGTYNKPHTISRIEFTNGKSPVTNVVESRQVISEAAAYLTTELMNSNVKYYGGSYDLLKNDTYEVYAKTGTTDWGGAGKEFGIPSGANKDAWIIAATSDYTTATWVGYEKAVVGQPSYITNEYYFSRPQSKIAKTILDACYETSSTKPVKIAQPTGVTAISHILGTWPYASTKIDGVDVDDSLKTTGLIKTDSVKLVSISSPEITAETNGSSASLSNENSSDATLTINWDKYPDSSALEEVSDEKDTSLRNSKGEVLVAASGKVLFDYSWIYGPIRYCADVTVSVNGKNNLISVESDNNSKSVSIGDIRDGATISVDTYYRYKNSSTRSKNKIVNLTKDVTERTISALGEDTSALAVKSWCENNGIDFDYEIVSSDERIIVKDTDGNDYDYRDEHKIKASKKLKCTYQINIRIDTSVENDPDDDNKKIVTFTAIFGGHSLDNLLDEIEYLYLPINDYVYSEIDNKLKVTMPKNKTSMNLGVKCGSFEMPSNTEITFN